MITRFLDAIVGTFSPTAAVHRAKARRVLRSYAGAEASRLTNHRKPQNQAADSELLGPFGADAARAWARDLVRNNAYAWGVVDTIVSSVVGCGIRAQSMLETEDSRDDEEEINRTRDEVWEEWAATCDVNGQLNFYEIQSLAQREIVEAGEVFIHVHNVEREHHGIYRRVPLALELIEADRLASDRDTYAAMRAEGRGDGVRIVRGVEMDALGKPIAYWIYPEHPNSPSGFYRQPKRIPASDIIHLYRQDRIGQSRGITWFAPVMNWLRDLGNYCDNELQASAVASCFGVAIKSTGGAGGLHGPDGSDETDANGNALEYLEPAMISHLMPGEEIQIIDPGRPNANAEPWISLMLRGIAVGTGLSYEIVARDYSKTTYSSSRTSQLEDRRRFRRWQKYLVDHLCDPVRDRFHEAAAIAGIDGFPTMSELLTDRNVAMTEWQPQEWEWVDPQNEQAASEKSISAYQSTYQEELGKRGRNWKTVMYQRAKEEKLKSKLGLIDPAIAEANAKSGASQSEPEASPAENETSEVAPV